MGENIISQGYIDWLKSKYYCERVSSENNLKNLKALDKALKLPLREYRRKR